MASKRGSEGVKLLILQWCLRRKRLPSLTEPWGRLPHSRHHYEDRPIIVVTKLVTNLVTTTNRGYVCRVGRCGSVPFEFSENHAKPRWGDPRRVAVPAPPP